MRQRFFIMSIRQTLAALGSAMVLASCGGGGGNSGGDGTSLASDLYGTWQQVEIQVLATIQTCPGEIDIPPTQSVSCFTTVVSFNADGTYVSVDSTDELGNPFNERTEGTWSTSGNTLTITETMRGPDAGSLVPIDPVEPRTLTWSVSTNGLTMTMDDPDLGPPVTARLERP